MKTYELENRMTIDLCCIESITPINVNTVGYINTYRLYEYDITMTSGNIITISSDKYIMKLFGEMAAKDKNLARKIESDFRQHYDNLLRVWGEAYEAL